MALGAAALGLRGVPAQKAGAGQLAILPRVAFHADGAWRVVPWQGLRDALTCVTDAPDYCLSMAFWGTLAFEFIF